MKRRAFFGILLIALLIRVVVSYAIYGAAHTAGPWEAYGYSILAGENVYLEYADYVYGPPWMYITAVAAFISQHTSVPFYFLIKIPSIIADVLIVVLLYLCLPAAKRRIPVFLYAVNPVSILVLGAINMFDVVASLFGLLAFFFVLRSSSRTRLFFSAAALATGAAIKTFPAIFLPALLLQYTTFRKRLAYIGIFTTVIFLFYTPSLIDPSVRLFDVIAHNTFGYDAPPGLGYSKLILVAEAVFPQLSVSPSWALVAHQIPYRFGNIALLLILCGIALFVLPFLSVRNRIITTITAFLSFSSGMGPQYLSWLIPYGVMERSRWFWIYTAVSTVFLTATAITWKVWLHPPHPGAQYLSFAHFVSVFAGLGTWITLLLWLRFNIRKTRHNFSIKKAFGTWLPLPKRK